MKPIPFKKIIYVISLGNEFRQDDGIGKYVTAEIANLYQENKTLIVLNNENSGISLLDFLDFSVNPGFIIFVDAADFGGNAGEIEIFDPKNIQEGGFNRMSTHTYDIFELLKTSTQMQIKIVGIQPKLTGWGNCLSSEVAASIPKTVNKINQLIASWRTSA